MPEVEADLANRWVNQGSLGGPLFCKVVFILTRGSSGPLLYVWIYIYGYLLSDSSVTIEKR